MKVAFDITPLDASNPHKVRGSGFYIENLRKSFETLLSEEEMTFFTRKNNIPKNVEVIHYPYFEPFFISLPAQMKIRSVVTVHDLTPLKFKKDFPVGIKGEIKWFIQKNRLKNADIIITDSYSSKIDIANILSYPEKKIKVIPLAAGSHFSTISDEKISEVRKKYSLPKKFVLYVGDVTRNKNLPRLAKALKKINLPFVLVGKAIKNEKYDHSNPWNKDLVELQEILRENTSTMNAIGFVTDDELIAIYNAATLFVMPSLYEGFGLPILEAMSCGTPVITSGEGSLSEVAGEAAIYVDPYNINSIAENIINLFNDEKLRNEFRIKGLERSKKYTWDKTATQTIAVYKDLVQNNYER